MIWLWSILYVVGMAITIWSALCICASSPLPRRWYAAVGLVAAILVWPLALTALGAGIVVAFLQAMCCGSDDLDDWELRACTCSEANPKNALFCRRCGGELSGDST